MRIIKILFLLLLSWGCVSFTQAASTCAEVWKQAGACYERHDYDSARMLYEQLAVSSPFQADLYYNLGNTYYRLNQIGPSILNYERALRIDPGMQLAKDNLQLARKRMTVQLKYAEDIFFIRWWKQLTAPSSAAAWAIFCFICFVLTIALILLRLLGGPKVKTPVQLPYIAACIWVITLFPAYGSAKNVQDSGMAVVMIGDTPLNATSQKGKPISLLPEGTTVQIKGVSETAIEVVIPDGRTGWVPLDAITRI